jgi:hypothetical protein
VSDDDRDDLLPLAELTSDALVFAVAVPASEVINLNDRGHWRGVHRQTVALRQRAGLTMRLLGRPRLEAATCEVAVFYPDQSRRRDVHNLMGTVKPLIDGMVSAGLLPDDADEYLTGPHLVRGVGDTPRGIIVVPRQARPFTFRFVFERRAPGVGA